MELVINHDQWLSVPHGRTFTGLLVALSVVLVASCSANPGPPPVEAPPAAENADAGDSDAGDSNAASDPDDARSRLTVGIDPLGNGFNPHLLADDTPFVRELAGLILPSAFRGGELDEDLLTSAEEVPVDDSSSETNSSEEDTSETSETSTTSLTTAPEQAGPTDEEKEEKPVQRVRYTINPAAQWSDGTPVSGNDFVYLRQQMVTTPGVIGVAGYQAISGISVRGAGRIVEVDFSRRIEDWQRLFSNLLPSHLEAGGGFTQLLADGIPAAAGRYILREVDRSRGTVKITRNDRFWGEDQAATEVINFQVIRRTMDATDQLRTGQMNFLDLAPTETSADSFALMPGIQTREVSSGRQLQLIFSATSGLIRTADERSDLAALIDIPLTARLATERSSGLDVASSSKVDPERQARAVEHLESLQLTRPLTIAADPFDARASAAARAIVDQLASSGIEARVTDTDLNRAMAGGLPDGEIDAVIDFGRTNPSIARLAGNYGCPSTPEELEAAESDADDADPATAQAPDQQAPRASLAGYCIPRSTELVHTMLAATGPAAEQAAEELQALVDEERLVVPIFNETRIQVLGEGMVGPEDELKDWSAGIATAATWRKEE